MDLRTVALTDAAIELGLGSAAEAREMCAQYGVEITTEEDGYVRREYVDKDDLRRMKNALAEQRQAEAEEKRAEERQHGPRMINVSSGPAPSELVLPSEQ
jgi:hypothetical protein